MTATEFLEEVWGKEKALEVSIICDRICMEDDGPPLNGVTGKDFFFSSPSAGGNWVGTLCNGIRQRFPEVYDAMPDVLGQDDKGIEAYVACLAVLCCLGADVSQRDVITGKRVMPWA